MFSTSCEYCMPLLSFVVGAGRACRAAARPGKPDMQVHFNPFCANREGKA
ncbi:hypothetical protein COLSTE_01484 [Collinsella stercoris DSM 13279]|uniref:Uncharacterized protein n=1 Tax=Collinsella stercoris DSM 13279 TaxID=445975 RepID=B6GBM2_9ACTN|nr:hypothetical protein COLSTE_01484 [Collinsella stercoris DSM 13279]